MVLASFCQTRAIVLAAAFELLCCAHETAPPDQGDDASVSADVQALQKPPFPYCVAPGAEKTFNLCDSETWPNRRIPYKFDPSFTFDKALIRSGMDEWEYQTSNFIRFDPNITADDKLVVNITNCKKDPVTGNVYGESKGFWGCKNEALCEAYLCDNFRHELGHLIGLGHQHMRNDRNHYLKISTYMGCEGDAQRCSEPSRSNYLDLGPYNYQSVMMYPATHPTWVRYNDEPFCAELNSDGVTCKYDVWSRVMPRDGAAAIELYQATKYSGMGWTKFQRTVLADATGRGLEPLREWNGMPEGHGIPSDASPAIETWGGDSLAIYARANDDRIYTKSFQTNDETWTNWTSVGAPPDIGSLSDPAVVSWASGRTDLVVRRGREVFITSSPIWSEWQSLGSPLSAADSAPAITSVGPDHLMVFVRAEDGRAYFRACTAGCVGNSGTWTDWIAIGNDQIRGKPAATSRADGFVNVAAQGLDGRILLAEFSPNNPPTGWSDPGSSIVMTFQASCPDCSSPALGARTNNSLDFYVRGLDDKVWLATLSLDGSGNQAWTSTVFGAVVSTSPATISKFRPDGRADLVVTMNENYTINRTSASTWWKRLK